MRPNFVKKAALPIAMMCAGLVLSTPALANPVIPVPTQPQQAIYTPSAPSIEGTSYILLDATSGKILAQKDADKRVPPASLTKLMSLYIISAATLSIATVKRT